MVVGSCNNINDQYAKMCVPDVLKSLNVKGFTLISRTNKTRHIEWHETCNCKFRFVDQMQAFVIMNNVGMMINGGVNAKD